MPVAFDLTGQRFSRLIVLEYVGSRRDGKGKLVRRVKVRCDCGNERIVDAARVSSGHTRSCGCLKAEHMRRVAATGAGGRAQRRHGHTADANRRQHTPTYRSWQVMIRRCVNPRVDKYAFYGGRGIEVCERWRTFENFLADMGERPDGLVLRRIDTDGHYEPGNCRWAPLHQLRAA